MSRLDYSKWDHIEISDDEDDTHPNIDTASLFRWRHQARVERMEQKDKEKKDVEEQIKSKQQQMTEMKKKLQKAQEEAAAEDLNKLKLEMSELEKQEHEWKKKENELKKKEKAEPWNIDTICHEGKSRTVINSKNPKKSEELSEEERAENQRVFVNKHRDEIKKYGMFRRYEDSQTFLMEHKYLVCEETANYLVVWCIDLEIEEKKELAEHVAHQTIVMQFILELAKQLDRDPRECVGPFFSRIKVAERQYLDSFNEELDAFKERVRKRAKERVTEAMAEYEEEEKVKRLGPGGLDPIEVFETLPDVLKQCFESKDIDMLKKSILELPKEEAEYHMKRCVESGLWVPNADDSKDASSKETKPMQESGEEEYASINPDH